MEAVLKLFSELLHTRFEKSVPTTEDAIRYTFFHAVMASSPLQPHDVILEYHHPQIPQAVLDTFLSGFRGRGVVVEFKYDRDNPSGRSLPSPQKAGAIFNDIRRLGTLTDSNVDRLLVYCAKGAMVNYLRRPRNGLADFFGLPKGATLPIDAKYVSAKSATFKNRTGEIPSVDICCLWTCSLPDGHELRVFRILPRQ